MFFYWGGDRLSYLRYLTLESFCKYNPDWDVYLYVPYKPYKGVSWSTGEQSGEYKGRCYLKDTKKLPIEIVEFNMRELSRTNNMPEVYKSDIIRYWLIYNQGGFWSDMDILYTKPLKIPLTKDVVCRDLVEGHYSIGLIGGKRRSELYYTLVTKALMATGVDYQSYGCLLWEGLNTSSSYNLPIHKIYAIDSTRIPSIYESGVLPNKSIGCHWYAGHPISKEWEDKITPKNYDYDNVLCNCIKVILDD